MDSSILFGPMGRGISAKRLGFWQNLTHMIMAAQCCEVPAKQFYNVSVWRTCHLWLRNVIRANQSHSNDCHRITQFHWRLEPTACYVSFCFSVQAKGNGAPHGSSTDCNSSKSIQVGRSIDSQIPQASVLWVSHKLLADFQCLSSHRTTCN